MNRLLRSTWALLLAWSLAPSSYAEDTAPADSAEQVNDEGVEAVPSNEAAPANDAAAAEPSKAEPSKAEPSKTEPPKAEPPKAEPAEEAEERDEALGELDAERYRPSVREIPFETGDGPGKVLIVIEIDGVIDLGLAPFIARVVDEANERGDVAAIISDIDTPGGRVDAALEIKDAYLRSTVPTVAWVHSQAISAGALIAYAHDYILFAPGGTMGAATPIQMGAGGDAQEVGEKVVSFMRGVMRATAEANGRDGDIAEAMVDRSTKIAGITTSKRLVTLTDKQALAWGVGDAAAGTMDEVVDYLHVGGATIERAEINWAERVARVLTDPTISSILISLGMLGLLIELSTPGFGIPGALGVSALLVFFFGHSVVNLAGLEELALLMVGLVLLGVEVFVIPGFGLVGVLGIGSILASLVMMMVGLPLELSWEIGDLSSAIVRVAVSFVGTIAFAVLLFRFFPQTPAGRRLVLATELSDATGYQSFSPVGAGRATGAVGVVTTALRPVGKARIDGELVDVVSEGEYLSKGAAVVVVRVEGARVVVREIRETT